MSSIPSSLLRTQSSATKRAEATKSRLFYVGQYEWRPGLVEIVILKDGKLLSQLDADEDEYLPLGSDTFFARSDLGSVSFLRDAEGRVMGSTYHRVDGQEIHLKRIR